MYEDIHVHVITMRYARARGHEVKRRVSLGRVGVGVWQDSEILTQSIDFGLVLGRSVYRETIAVAAAE